MPFAIVTSNLDKDDPNIQMLSTIFSSLDIQYDFKYPSNDCISSLKAFSLADGRVDLIIIYYNRSVSTELSIPFDLIKKIRNIPDNYSFQSSIKVRSVPILLIIRGGIFSQDLPYDNKNYSWVKIYSLDNGIKGLQEEVIDLLGNWRKDLLSELECVGYAVIIDSVGNINVEPTFKRIKPEGDILANKTTLEKLRKSKYLILSKELLEEIEPYRELQFLLNNYKKLAEIQSKKPEEIFQIFFEKNPSFILSDQFQVFWAKPKLKLPEKPETYLSPDFVLKPKVAELYGTKWEILDLKLPDTKLTLKTKFHPGFTSQVIKSIQQLYDYRAYFNRPDNDAKQELIKNFGYAPKNPRLAILIGRDKNIDSDILVKTQGELKYLDIELITYDELLDSRAREIIIQSDILKAIS